MKVFGTDTSMGCFIRFNLDASNSRGTTLKLPGGTELPGKDQYPLVVTGVNFHLKENVAHLKCFNTRVYTFAFGADIGALEVTYVGFLNQGSEYKDGAGSGGGGGDTDVVTTMLQAYDQSRISASKKEAILYMGTTGEVIRGQIVGITSQTKSAMSNLQSFTVELVYVPKPAKEV